MSRWSYGLRKGHWHYIYRYGSGRALRKCRSAAFGRDLGPPVKPAITVGNGGFSNVMIALSGVPGRPRVGRGAVSVRQAERQIPRDTPQS